MSCYESSYLSYSRADEKDLRKIFSEFSDKECQVQSVKGAGTWSRRLIEKGHKTLLIFGEFQPEELIEFARASRQHKKAQKVLDGADKAKKKRGRPKKALPIKDASPLLDGNLFMKLFDSNGKIKADDSSSSY